MNNGVIYFDPQDSISITECKLHGDYEGNYCPDCFLDERRREIANEVNSGIVETALSLKGLVGEKE